MANNNRSMEEQKFSNLKPLFFLTSIIVRYKSFSTQQARKLN